MWFWLRLSLKTDEDIPFLTSTQCERWRFCVHRVLLKKALTFRVYQSVSGTVDDTTLREQTTSTCELGAGDYLVRFTTRSMPSWSITKITYLQSWTKTLTHESNVFPNTLHLKQESVPHPGLYPLPPSNVEVENLA